jgi:hypothetical protein
MQGWDVLRRRHSSAQSSARTNCGWRCCVGMDNQCACFQRLVVDLAPESPAIHPTVHALPQRFIVGEKGCGCSPVSDQEGDLTFCSINRIAKPYQDALLQLAVTGSSPAWTMR